MRTRVLLLLFSCIQNVFLQSFLNDTDLMLNKKLPVDQIEAIKTSDYYNYVLAELTVTDLNGEIIVNRYVPKPTFNVPIIGLKYKKIYGNQLILHFQCDQIEYAFSCNNIIYHLIENPYTDEMAIGMVTIYDGETVLPNHQVVICIDLKTNKHEINLSVPPSHCNFIRKMKRMEVLLPGSYGLVSFIGNDTIKIKVDNRNTRITTIVFKHVPDGEEGGKDLRQYNPKNTELFYLYSDDVLVNLTNLYLYNNFSYLGLDLVGLGLMAN